MVSEHSGNRGGQRGMPAHDPVAIYCRVSSEEQAHSGTIQNQVDLPKRHCETLQVPIADLYLDDGISGTAPIGDRPEGARLLRDAEAKRLASFLVSKTDRLRRSVRHSLDAVGQLEKPGVQVKSITEPLDTSPGGRLQLNMMASVAELERQTLLERSTHGTNRLSLEGAWLGGIVPYGYYKEGKGRQGRW